MGGKSRSSSFLNVPQLLNEAQRATSAGSHRYAKLLWEVANDEREPGNTISQIVFGMKIFLTVAEVLKLPNSSNYRPSF
jgi:hypothetical protein